MNVYETLPTGRRIAGNPYVGRGIVMGKTEDGRAAAAYFIMGRSENSRNRVFVREKDGTLFTRPYDETKVSDPSLIIYAAARTVGRCRVVTNGDQTDTVAAGLKQGRSFADALTSRAFEPDAPNFTPRISGMLTLGEGDFRYEMSILKSADAAGSACNRFHFAYAALPGVGHFLHTYVTDGDPIPTFTGEPERVSIPNDLDAWTDELWNALDPANKISLYTEYIHLETGSVCWRLVNRNGNERQAGEGQI